MGRMYVYKYVSQCSPARRVRLENLLPLPPVVAVSHSPGARSSSPEVASNAGKLGLAASCERSSLRGLPAPVCSRHRNGYAKVCQGISYLFSSKCRVQCENRGSATVPVEEAYQHAPCIPNIPCHIRSRSPRLPDETRRRRQPSSSNNVPRDVSIPYERTFLAGYFLVEIASDSLG